MLLKDSIYRSALELLPGLSYRSCQGPESPDSKTRWSVSHPLGCPVQTVQSPALLSRPVAAPEEGLVDGHEQEHVVTSQPVQEVVEQPGQPGPGGGLLSGQVDLVSRDTSDGFRRSSRVTRQPDFYGR